MNWCGHGAVRYTVSVANLHILTGECEYLLWQETYRWIAEFSKKYGAENVCRREGATVTIRSLLDDVSVLPFLAEKRLIVVDGMPRCTADEARLLHAGMHPDALLLLVDPKPDKRRSGIKELLSLAEENVREFPQLKGATLLRWIDAYVTQQGRHIAAAARDLLADWHGNDIGMIAGDLDKLVLVAHGTPISASLVEEYCMPSDEGIVWTITDLVTSGQRNAALLYAQRMMERGTDAHGLWALLLSFVKNAVTVRAAIDAGIQTGMLPAATGMHPFALRSLRPYCGRIDVGRLHALLRWTAQQDVRIKTGAYRSSQEEAQEVQSLVALLLLRTP